MNEAKTVKMKEREREGGEEGRKEDRTKRRQVIRGQNQEIERERGKAVVPVQRVLVEYFGARR